MTTNSARYRAAVVAVLCALLVPSYGRAQQGDATQSIESPLGPGTGVTLTASQGKTALTLGLQRQYSNAYEWLAAIEGVVKETDAKALFSRSAGAEPGVTARVGWAYVPARKANLDARINACDALARQHDEFLELGNAEKREAACKTTLNDIETQVFGDVSTVPVAGATTTPKDLCRRHLDALVLRITTALTGVDPTDPMTAKHRAELASLLAIRKKVDEQLAAKQLGPVEASLLDITAENKKVEKKFLSCQDRVDAVEAMNDGDIESLSSTRREMYKQLASLVLRVRRSRVPTTRWRIGINGFLGVQGGTFRPIDDEGMLNLSTRESWNEILPGFSVDGTLFVGGRIVLATALGYTSALDVKTVKVCRTTLQDDFSAQDCTDDALGEPEAQHRVFASGALSLNPLINSEFLGDFQLGMQVAGLLAVTTAQDIDLFDKGSASYRISVPIFIMNSEESLGLAAGFAPEFSATVDTDDPEEFRVLFFVGGRSFDAPKK